MADLLRQGSEWLEEMRDAHLTSPVEYHHTDGVLIVQATFGRTRYEVAQDYSGGGGMTIGSHVWDFLIRADALADLDDKGPGTGDLIVADGRRYEVMAFGEDIRGWRWSDPYRKTYRIHTREIGAVDD